MSTSVRGRTPNDHRMQWPAGPIGIRWSNVSESEQVIVRQV